MTHHHATVAVTDLFAVGLGCEFAGAVALVRGLVTSARDFSVRFARSRNTFNWWNVQVAEGRADSLVGVGAIAVGFLVQAVAYVLQVGGWGTRPTGGPGAAA